MNLAKYPALRCIRCDKKRENLSKCEKPGCDFDIYRNDIVNRFKSGPPVQYYITISGAVNAGKTLYLLTLIHYLLEDRDTGRYLDKEFGITDISLTDSISRRYYSEFMQDFKQGRLELTNMSTPLSFFSLTILKSGDNSPIELILFNSSGEKIEDVTIEKSLNNQDHELMGMAVLHFIDPRGDAKINQILKNPINSSGRDAPKDLKIVDFLHKLIQHNNHGIQYLNLPFGICVSKFDLLTHMIPESIPENVYVDAPCPRIFKEIEKSSRALEKFLRIYSTTIDTEGLLTKFNKKGLRYFSVAAFGRDALNPRWDDNNPRGVLAPFIWVLKELQIISNSYDG